MWNISIKQGGNVILDKPFLLLCCPWPILKGREGLAWQLYFCNRHCFKHYALTFLLRFLFWLSCLGICNKPCEATSWIFGNQVSKYNKGTFTSNKTSKICWYYKVLVTQTMTEHGNKTEESAFAKQAVLHWSDFVKQRKCHLGPGGAERKCPQDWIFSPANIEQNVLFLFWIICHAAWF